MGRTFGVALAQWCASLWTIGLSLIAAHAAAAVGEQVCRCDTATVSCLGGDQLEQRCQGGLTAACTDKRSCRLYMTLFDCQQLGFQDGQTVAPAQLVPSACREPKVDPLGQLPPPSFFEVCATIVHEVAHLSDDRCGGRDHTTLLGEQGAYGTEVGYYGGLVTRFCPAGVNPALAEIECAGLCEQQLRALAYTAALRCAAEFINSQAFSEIPAVSRLIDSCYQRCVGGYSFVGSGAENYPPQLTALCRTVVPEAQDRWAGFCQEGLYYHAVAFTPNREEGSAPTAELYEADTGLIGPPEPLP
jgi:hypothetical protein